MNSFFMTKYVREDVAYNSNRFVSEIINSQTIGSKLLEGETLVLKRGLYDLMQYSAPMCNEGLF